MKWTHAAWLCGGSLLALAGLAIAGRTGLTVEIAGPRDAVQKDEGIQRPERPAGLPWPIQVEATSLGMYGNVNAPVVSTDSIAQIDTAIDALELARGVILNNLANAQTVGFKRSSVQFEDLPYNSVKFPGQLDAASRPTPIGLAVGMGARLRGAQLDHKQGGLLDTGSMLDLAIVGEGFFQINDGTNIFYTRAGNFSINANGDMTVASADRGRLIEPNINIPKDATEIAVSPEGIVSVMTAGSTTLTQLGQLQLVRFVNPGGLVQKGECLFQDTGAAGNPIIAQPGQDGTGLLRQRFLENANVEPSKELTELRRIARQLAALAEARAVSAEPLATAERRPTRRK